MATLERIWRAYEDGRHNAFTDLVRWRNHWWLAFRNGEAHSSLDGVILVLRSSDLETWELAAKIETEGDDRDAHFVVTDTDLWVYIGSWTIEGDQRGFIRSFCSSTADGSTWSQPTQVYEPHVWLWHPVWLEKGFFCCAAYGGQRIEGVNIYGPLLFLRSSDGTTWSQVADIAPPEEELDEAHLYRQPDGTLVGIVRSELTGEKLGCRLVRSHPPYTEWETKHLPTLVHAPCLLPVGDRLLVAGRCLNEQIPAHLSPGSWRSGTALWWLENDQLEPALWLPSGGDNAYPGMALADDGSVIVSYYSQHEYLDQPGFQPSGPPASIYLAKVILS